MDGLAILLVLTTVLFFLAFAVMSANIHRGRRK